MYSAPPPSPSEPPSPLLRHNFLPTLDIRQDAQMRKVPRLTRKRPRRPVQIQTLVRTARRVDVALIVLPLLGSRGAGPGAGVASGAAAKERAHGWEAGA